MKLIHTATQEPAAVGDQVTNSRGSKGTILHFTPPHKEVVRRVLGRTDLLLLSRALRVLGEVFPPSSSGHVTVDTDEGSSYNYYVGVWGLEWIERDE